MSRELSERLVDRVHAAALDPEGWPEALRGIARFVGADAVILGIHDVAAPIGADGSRFVTAVGLPPAALGEFRRRFVHPETNVLVRQLTAVAPAIPVPRGQLQDGQTYRSSEIYRTILKPAGYDPVVFGCAAIQDGLASPVSFLRRATRPDFDAPEIARIATVLPHLGRAMRTAIRLESTRARRDRAEVTLDRVHVPVATVTVERTLLFANAAMSAWLDGSRVLDTRHGRLHARDPRTDAALGRLLARIGATGAQPGPPAELGLPAGPHNPPATLTLTALPSGALRSDGRHLLVTIASDAAGPGPRTLAIPAAYGLTPRETALVHALVDTGGLAAAAQAVGMKVVTARNHLKRIFAKTDTRSQVELVRLVLTGGPRPRDAGAENAVA